MVRGCCLSIIFTHTLFLRRFALASATVCFTVLCGTVLYLQAWLTELLVLKMACVDFEGSTLGKKAKGQLFVPVEFGACVFTLQQGELASFQKYTKPVYFPGSVLNKARLVVSDTDHQHTRHTHQAQHMHCSQIGVFPGPVNR
jgi:hypothetical protein